MFFSFLLLFNLFVIQIKTEICECPVYEKLHYFSKFKPNPNFELQDEIIEGENYGKPVQIEDMLILRFKDKVLPSTTVMENICPLGYEYLNKDDLKLISNNKDNYEKLALLGIVSGNYICSNTKTYPTKTNRTDYYAWVYACLKYGYNGAMSVSSLNTYFSGGRGFVICKAETAATIKKNNYDHSVDHTYKLSLQNNNIKSLFWKVDGEETQNDFVIVSSKREGCSLVQVWTLNVDDQIGYNCEVINVISPLGSDGKIEEMEEDEIEVKVLPDYKVSSQIYLFFNRPDTAISPRSDGNFYVFFSDSDKTTKVLLMDGKDLSELKTYTIEKDSYALDIVHTTFGFAIYLKSSKDNNSSWLSGYNEDGSLKFKRAIIDPGQSTEEQAQLTFYNESGEILFGMNSMFSSSSGKLAYGRNRIALLFSHYNSFESDSYHTGDTFVTFNDEGEKEDYAWAWGTSHSLYQSMFYDGQYFITASLGDLYPENVRVCFVKPNNYSVKYDSVRKDYVNLNKSCNDNLIPGKLPGDGQGDSCGLLGNITNFGDTYVLVYSRKACTMKAYNGGTTSEERGEIGFVKFKFKEEIGEDEEEKDKFYDIESFDIGDGNDVAGIRSQKHGDKILIVMSITPYPKSTGQTNYKFFTQSEYTKMMLVDLEGNVITSPFEYDGPFAVTKSEDMKILKDGSVVWAVPDKWTKELTILKTSPPKEYIDPYRHSYGETHYIPPTPEIALPVILETYDKDYFKGKWIAIDSNCLNQSDTRNDVVIEHTEGQFSFELLEDNCVEAKQVSFDGVLEEKYQQCHGSYSIPCVVTLGKTDNSQSVYSGECMIEISNINSFNIPQWNLVLNRVIS